MKSSAGAPGRPGTAPHPWERDATTGAPASGAPASGAAA
jgi:hypothetical protein